MDYDKRLRILKFVSNFIKIPIAQTSNYLIRHSILVVANREKAIAELRRTVAEKEDLLNRSTTKVKD